MKKYYSPFVMFLNGTISMTASQLGQLGISIDVDAWNDWWAEVGDLVAEFHPDFDIEKRETWPAGFDSAIPETWEVLLDWE